MKKPEIEEVRKLYNKILTRVGPIKDWSDRDCDIFQLGNAGQVIAEYEREHLGNPESTEKYWETEDE